MSELEDVCKALGKNDYRVPIKNSDFVFCAYGASERPPCEHIGCYVKVAKLYECTRKKEGGE